MLLLISGHPAITITRMGLHSSVYRLWGMYLILYNYSDGSSFQCISPVGYVSYSLQLLRWVFIPVYIACGVCILFFTITRMGLHSIVYRLWDMYLILYNYSDGSLFQCISPVGYVSYSLQLLGWVFIPVYIACGVCILFFTITRMGLYSSVYRLWGMYLILYNYSDGSSFQYISPVGYVSYSFECIYI